MRAPRLGCAAFCASCSLSTIGRSQEQPAYRFTYANAARRLAWADRDVSWQRPRGTKIDCRCLFAKQIFVRKGGTGWMVYDRERKRPALIGTGLAANLTVEQADAYRFAGKRSDLAQSIRDARLCHRSSLHMRCVYERINSCGQERSTATIRRCARVHRTKVPLDEPTDTARCFSIGNRPPQVGECRPRHEQ
ncbi:hypothetical protein ABIE89_000054 [Bradyrhizobium niftali]